MYCLVNYNEFKIICCSEDQSLLEELMLDFFMEDVYYRFCYLINYCYGTDIDEIAWLCWEQILDYYRDYIGIEETLIFE